ncbi:MULTISPECIES: type IV pilus biogenesis/stability protein PilW [Cupriavidus]|jgi:type IV pilus assembly protein PilF|uniref:Type IV pilus biogenesis/stability protein PilW n=1 Tax=Cupriavidus pauculus TaxID=82633 RepID=A0A5P2H148_9BURK|nr:type IV pilus biogenesis/stability protein PilW [Cupriavidus pauculus]QET01265.1 type IV pilus biogenesis/stability protein PilW [Cupriavidus pauculus]
MMRLIVAALFGLVMLSACTLPNPQPQGIPTASDQTDVSRRAMIRLQLAMGYLEAGQYSVALDESKQAIAIDPAMVDAYHMRALAYQGMNERALAEDSFRTALSMRPNDADVLNNYGWFLCQNNRAGEGLPILRRAVDAPSASGPVKPLISLGVCEMRTGNSEGAEKTLLRALGYDRNNQAAITNLALVYYRRGDLVQAQQYIGRVNNSRTPSAQSLWLGLRIAHRRGDATTQNALVSQLRSRFPESRELSAFEQGAWDE